jgi:mannose-6-phosphate isomerase-like protein (cupin superfamily)
MFKQLILVLPLAAFAADPAGFQIWKAGDLKNYEKKLSQKVDAQKISGQSLGSYGNHTTSLSHREGSGVAEVHEHVNDIFMIQSGEGIIIIGGKVVQPKTTAPGEIRGPSIEGGTKHPVAVGDILHIPANVPHQFLVDAGKQVTYFVVKVDAK